MKNWYDFDTSKWVIKPIFFYQFLIPKQLAIKKINSVTEHHINANLTIKYLYIKFKRSNYAEIRMKYIKY